MTDTTTETVERLAETAAAFHATRQPKIEAGDNYKSAVFKMGFRSGYVSAVDASKTPDPVTNADSCQPTRTYEDGVRDAQAMAISAIEDQFPGALYASNRTKCINLIKEKSHE